jgi:hypothetical protein
VAHARVPAWLHPGMASGAVALGVRSPRVPRGRLYPRSACVRCVCVVDVRRALRRVLSRVRWPR